MNLLARAVDGFVESVAPDRGLRRRMARAAVAEAEQGMTTLAAMDAARTDGPYAAQPVHGIAPRTGLLQDIDVSTTRGRKATLNTWQVASIRGAYRRGVVGTGITAKPSIRWDANAIQRYFGDNKTSWVESAERWNRRVRDDFNHWANTPEACSVCGTMDFAAIQSQMLEEMIVSGSGFCFASTDGRGSNRRKHGVPSLRLQTFELEQLAKDLDDDGFGRTRRDLPGGRKLAKGDVIVGGVQLAASGRVVGYWVHVEEHPQEGFGRRGYDAARFLPVSRVMHLHQLTRPGELLPPPLLGPVLANVMQVHEYDAQELIQKRKASFLGLFLKRMSKFLSPMAMAAPAGVGLPGGPGYGGGAGAGGPGSPGLAAPVDSAGRQAVGGGRPSVHLKQFSDITMLNEGEDVGVVDTGDRPGNLYPEYMKIQNRQIAAGAGLSRSLMERDYTGATLQSHRIGIIEDRATFDALIQLKKVQVLDKVRGLWLEAAVLEGQYAMTGFLEDPYARRAWSACDWQGPPRRDLDPAKDAARRKMDIEGFHTTHEEIANEQGKSARELIVEAAAFRDFAEADGCNVRLPEFARQRQEEAAEKAAAVAEQAARDGGAVTGGGGAVASRDGGAEPGGGGVKTPRPAVENRNGGAGVPSTHGVDRTPGRSERRSANGQPRVQ